MKRQGRRSGWVISIVVAISAAACSSPVGSGSTTTSVVDNSSTTTEGVVLSDLVGDWGNGEWFLQIADDGLYQVLETPTSDPNDPLMGGFLARDGAKVNFVTDIYGECAGQTGVYEVLLVDARLTLILIDDPCEFRATRFVEPWERAD
ncbi:MAG TPA: hypothetical protein VFL72_00760 [Acidimicrobiia bacterium]|nr:hypothetical protein [Acidimicrobiia bacterium]